MCIFMNPLHYNNNIFVVLHVLKKQPLLDLILHYINFVVVSVKTSRFLINFLSVEFQLKVSSSLC